MKSSLLASLKFFPVGLAKGQRGVARYEHTLSRLRDRRLLDVAQVRELGLEVGVALLLDQALVGLLAVPGEHGLGDVEPLHNLVAARERRPSRLRRGLKPAPAATSSVHRPRRHSRPKGGAPGAIGWAHWAVP